MSLGHRLLRSVIISIIFEGMTKYTWTTTTVHRKGATVIASSHQLKHLLPDKGSAVERGTRTLTPMDIGPRVHQATPLCPINPPIGLIGQSIVPGHDPSHHRITIAIKSHQGIRERPQGNRLKRIGNKSPERKSLWTRKGKLLKTRSLPERRRR